MNKKTYLWLVVGLLIIFLILIMVKKNGPQSEITPEANTPAATSNETGEPVAPVLSAETVFKVNGTEFTPKTVESTTGVNTFMTFTAEDDADHTFAFVDPSLAYITLSFNKEEGGRSINFPTPEPGSYTFYFDDTDNTGTLIVK
jgi:uncharacterized protein YfaT (DUF1175 family)